MIRVESWTGLAASTKMWGGESNFPKNVDKNKIYYNYYVLPNLSGIGIFFQWFPISERTNNIKINQNFWIPLKERLEKMGYRMSSKIDGCYLNLAIWQR